MRLGYNVFKISKNDKRYSRRKKMQICLCYDIVLFFKQTLYVFTVLYIHSGYTAYRFIYSIWKSPIR